MVKGPNSEGLYTFKNGAKAIKLPNGRYQIVKGASKQYMQSIRTQRKQQQHGGIGEVPATECTCYMPWDNGCAQDCPVCPTPDEWDNPSNAGSECPWSCTCRERCATAENPTFENCSADCIYYLCKRTL